MFASVDERAAPPSSWSRAVTTFYGAVVPGSQLFGVGHALRCAGSTVAFLGDDFWNQLHCSVPVLGSTPGDFFDSFQDLSPNSSLSLVRLADTCTASVYGGFLEDAHTFSQCWWTPGDDVRIVSVFSAELGSTANTCAASVYEAFWKRGFSLGDDFRIISASS